MARRLPVYLLLDCSGSMSGEPIEAVRQGVSALINDLRDDPQAIETAYISIITFASSAQQVCPLTELMAFNIPDFQAGGTTAMGEALRLLKTCVENEVAKTTETQKGDWKPLIFIMTDGQPTDSWEQAADDIKKSKPGNIIACAAGSGADAQMLKRVTEIVVQLNTLQPKELQAFFKWVTASIKTTSASISANNDAPVPLPPTPCDIVIVP